ncbi:protein OS-9 isoform X1 [Aplysia californica]|uniref:Protein OS-9 isoform X1 n=1 Tax=Aplysia californica TaxID=6500 RepID=A0ABM0ZWT5_APLCA|nr:protein OS-9 isoform X1 [Aplysia californica]
MAAQANVRSCRSWLRLKFAVFLFILQNVVHVKGFMDMEELKSVYYGLDILSEPVVIQKDAPVGAVHVMSKYGQQYQCTFPDHSIEEKKKEEEEKIAIESGIVEMLKPLGLKDCLFKSKDWWSYEFCYGKFIRQFHMEDGEIKGNIIYLGNYAEDFDWNNETAREERLRSKASISRYHSQTYTLGTKCDLTGQPRRAEVRFMCEENSEDYLARVDEAETCVYTVTIMTSRICRHPYLKAPARRKPVAITCNPLLTEIQFHDYMEEKAERQRKEQLILAAAKQRYGSKATLSPTNLDKTLEQEMSRVAKELLTQPIDKLFPIQQRKVMAKEEFVKTFGENEDLWTLYLRGVEVNKKRQEEIQRRLEGVHQRMKEKREELSSQEKEEEETAEEAKDGKEKDNEEKTKKEDGETEDTLQEVQDEDDELLAEFDAEINAIKARFHQSLGKLSSMQQKLNLQRNWESEIENVIKEAESELGVKVDRTLISGLSNTLDKLVNKLHDTQTQLSTMDNELEKLYKKGKKKAEEGEDEEDKEGESQASDDMAEEDVGGGSKASTHDLGMEDPESELDGQEFESDLESKILPPPKAGPGLTAIGGGVGGDHAANARPGTAGRENPAASQSAGLQDPTAQGGDELPGGVEDDGLLADDGGAVGGGGGGGGGEEAGAEEPVLKITISSTKREDEEEEDLELPGNVQKLLEESVRKEYERHRTQSDSQPLSFDADHSFHKDKTVHVIQQEDENGKTNRFIFVVGFDTFNDESSESMKQNQLEENYGFVYGEKKQKKSPPGS